MLLETRAALWEAGDTPPESAVELVDAGRSVAEVARDLGLSGQSIYQWRRQIRIDDDVDVGVASSQRAELAAANKRIAQLEKEQ